MHELGMGIAAGRHDLAGHAIRDQGLDAPRNAVAGAGGLMTVACNLRALALNLLFVSISAAIHLNVGINLMFSPLHDGRHGE